MITIEYGLDSYENFLKQLSKALKLKYSPHSVFLSAEHGEGFFRLLKFPGGIECLIFDATFNMDVQLLQKKIKEENLVIRMEDDSMDDELTEKATLQLNKTNQKWIFLSSKGQRISGINLLFPQNNMQNYFGNSHSGHEINNYLNLMNNLYYTETMDSEYKKLFGEIFYQEKTVFTNFIIYNRLLQIWERVFSRLYRKISGTTGSSNFSSDDIQRVKEAEAFLVSDFSEQPASLDLLAKKAAMSTSKFKIIFKEIYGMPPVRHFQNKRMLKAKSMILSKQYSITDIINELGFEKKAVFLAYYKKAFGEIPVV